MYNKMTNSNAQDSQSFYYSIIKIFTILSSVCQALHYTVPYHYPYHTKPWGHNFFKARVLSSSEQCHRQLMPQFLHLLQLLLHLLLLILHLLQLLLHLLFLILHLLLLLLHLLLVLLHLLLLLLHLLVLIPLLFDKLFLYFHFLLKNITFF